VADDPPARPPLDGRQLSRGSSPPALRLHASNKESV